MEPRQDTTHPNSHDRTGRLEATTGSAFISFRLTGHIALFFTHFLLTSPSLARYLLHLNSILSITLANFTTSC